MQIHMLIWKIVCVKCFANGVEILLGICRIETQRTIQERKTKNIIARTNIEHKSYVDILENEYTTYKVSSYTFSSLKFISSNIIDIMYMYVCERWLHERMNMVKKTSFYFLFFIFMG